MKNKSNWFLLLFLFLSVSVFSQDIVHRWAKQMGGIYGNDYINSIAIDSFGNLYSIGNFERTMDFDPDTGVSNLVSKGFNDIFIQKLDRNGKLIWAKGIGGSGYEWGSSITLDSKGNVYATGGFQDTVDFDPNTGVNDLISHGDADFFILKLDSNGSFKWVRQMGSDNYESGNAITIDENENVYTTGVFYDSLDLDPGFDTFNLFSKGNGFDGFIQKLSSNGDFIWAKGIIGSSYVHCKDLVADKRGNIYLASNFRGTVDLDPGIGVSNYTSMGEIDIFVLKLSDNGDFKWANQIGGPENEYPAAIAIDSSNNVYTVGRFEDSLGPDPSYKIKKIYSRGKTDAFIQKLDSNGNMVWIKQIGGNSSDEAYSIAIDKEQSIYTSGYFTGKVDFDPNINATFITSKGESDIFVQKLTPNGELKWVETIGGKGNDGAQSIAFSPNDDLNIVGYFNASVDFNTSEGLITLKPNGSSDIFMHKFGQCESSSTVDYIAACGSFTWINGKTYFSSINTEDTVYTNFEGCDSLIRLDLTISNVNNTTVVINDAIISNQSNASKYQWLDCSTNYSIIPGETNQIFKPKDNGKYAVAVTNNSCIDTSTCVEIKTLGVMENSFNEKVEIYPNPTKGNFSLEFEKAQKDIFISVLNISGQLIESRNYKNTSLIKMELNKPKGIYLLEVTSKNQKAVFKLMVE